MRAVTNLDSEPLDDVTWDSFVATSPKGRMIWVYALVLEEKVQMPLLGTGICTIRRKW